MLSIACGGGGEIFGDQMDYRGNDGRSSGRQQSKKKRGMKKFSANEGSGVGGMRMLGSDKFYDKSSKISSPCSNSYVKLDITKILQRKC